ncbi:MAG TPA: alpha/beta hydrolase, partial [Microbacteriaceae bacterium]|nr:alpha/beta hydrolase [Microbacteriaceae bacterium]
VARPAWGTAVVSGHRQIAAGLTIDVPVLTLLSKRSLISPVWRDGMLRADTVLVVDDIAKRAINLGETVTVVRIDGALHDVFLSAPEVRAEAYEQLDRWLNGYAKP